jgi:hypothetical protein
VHSQSSRITNPSLDEGWFTRRLLVHFGSQTATSRAKQFKGTPVAHLPIEFPTKLELVINLKTATVVGITVPPSLLAREPIKRSNKHFAALHESAIGPKQTWPSALHMSAFGGKADMTLCGNPLLRSLLGVKRTWLFAARMSAYDPKRTVGPFQPISFDR